MRIRRALEPPLTASAPLYVAAGMFDGVHRGHQAVIGAAVQAAAAHHGEAWVLTFDPHPSPSSPPNVHPLPSPPFPIGSNSSNSSASTASWPSPLLAISPG